MNSDKKRFLIANHIQGDDISKTRIGAYFENELVAVMTFKKTNMVKGGNGSQIELSRFAVKMNTSIPGIASKMLKFAQNILGDVEIISYADSRWSEGNIYKTLGFEFVSTSKPSFWYMDKYYKVRFHRSVFMKHKLTGDKSKTGWEIMKENGYDRIWDAGTTKWLLCRSNPNK